MINASSPSSHVNTSTGTSFLQISTSKLIVSLLLLVYFLFGLLMNSLYFWVVKFRMKPSINGIWLSHLIITNLVFILLLPFMAVYVLTEPHWVFGMFLCKVLHSIISICLFVSVFLITGVSVNRFLLVCYPHWYIERVRSRNVSAVCFGLWSLALVCSSPYLLFRVTQRKDDITVCYNDYTCSGRWENVEVQVKWGMFFFRILVSFLLPFVVIAVCHIKILFKIKKNQRRRSSRTYKIIFLATATFFICWAPYHIAYGMGVERSRSQHEVLLKLKIISVFVYSCISPVCYLFIMEKFTKELRKFIHLFASSD